MGQSQGLEMSGFGGAGNCCPGGGGESAERASMKSGYLGKT